MIKVFIGFDSRELEAYQVARQSILDHSDNVEVIALYQPVLRQELLYTREDKLGTTEFSLTRFLVPFLSDYKGYSIFVDCDILCNTDITKVLDTIDEMNAVSCVQHDYNPKTYTKMDGRRQTHYPRKNWSSFMVFNNEKCQMLTPWVVNNMSPLFLHRMLWADEKIGELHITWNYLVGYYNSIKKPNIIHYTDGGPWFEEYKNCEFSKEWKKYYEKIDISSVAWRPEQ